MRTTPSLFVFALFRAVSGFVPTRSARGFVSNPPKSSSFARTAQASQHARIRRTSASLPSSLPLSASATPESPPSSKHSPPSDWESQLLSALSVIIDPDLDSDIVSLGFVQNLRIDDSNVVSLTLELTTPACPVKDLFVQQCQDAVNSLDWTRGAEVTLSAQSTDASPGSDAPFGMSQIGAVVAVSSCKGGVGKSTTAVNLAFALESLGARVGIFDADVYGPSLPTMVTPEDDNVRFVGRQIAPLRRGNVSLMSFGYVNEGSAVMRGPMVTQLLDQFLSMTCWGPLDYLIMDMPPGTGDIQLTLSQRLNITAAVIVTTPQELSFVDVERGVEMFDTVNVPCIACVENMAYLEKESQEKETTIDEVLLREKFFDALQKDGTVANAMQATTVANDLVKIVQENIQNNNNNGEKEEIRIFGPGHKRRLSEQWGIEHTYSVPLMGQIAQNGDSGTPFVLDNPNSPQAEIYRQLAKSVVSEVAKIKFGKGKGVQPPSVSYDSEAHIIRVVEADGEQSAISPADLRRECRCAECVEEMSGKQILDPESVPESIRPMSMSPTGNYALSVDWSGGHRSLYPYRQIREILAKKEEQMNNGVEVEEEGVDSVLSLIHI